MPTVRYEVINGEVIAEKRGGVRRSYVPDPLGSTVALLDNTQAITDTFSYWPYGEVKNRTGTTPTPFQYVGTREYYRDSPSRDYVRARPLRKDLTRWMTEDPIGFEGGDWNLYRYVQTNPVTMVDPSGMFPCWICRVLGAGHKSGYCWSHCDGGKPKPKPKPAPKPPVICIIPPFTELPPISGHECVQLCMDLYHGSGAGWAICTAICSVASGNACPYLAGYCEGVETGFKKRVCEYLWSRLCLGGIQFPEP